MKRLFIGIALSDEARESLTAVQDKLREVATRQGVRFVRPDKMHLTLAFLDAHPEDSIDQIESLCLPICAATQSFDLGLQGLGAFPSFRRPKVLWAGVNGATNELLKIQSSLSAAVENFLSRSEGEYAPHISLARVVPGSPQVGRAVTPLAEELADHQITTWSVQDILLYESTPEGLYEVLRTWPLHGG